MNRSERSRRDFLKTSGVLAGGAAAALNLPAVLAAAQVAQKAHADKAGFKVLSMVEATQIEAIVAQIIPTDETPGAREAGVVYFIDEAFATFMSGALAGARQNFKTFQKGVREHYPGKPGFATLGDAQQIAYLKANEQDPLFSFLRFLTTLGVFAHPSYRGNRDYVGWQMIGFEHRHAWQPPFGYYDGHNGHDGDND